MTNKAIFFDRDDTLIMDTGYMYKTCDLKYFPDTISTLRTLLDQNYLIFIVTNQSGVGRGYFTIDQMHKFNQHMLNDLKKQGIEIQEITFCPHAPEDNCECRKPHPKLVNDLCTKYDVDKKNSFMFGDKNSDLEAGENAGLKSFKLHGENIAKVISHVSTSKS